jgi:AcrR family transcriptional regulator
MNIPAEGGSMAGEDAKRNQILDGAGLAFGQYGYKKTTLADIVRESGVARATVYKYFSSKEEVFQAVIDREIADILRTVRGAVEKQTNTYDRLRTAVTMHSSAIRERVNVFRLTMEAFTDVIGRTHRNAENMAREIVRLYTWILEEGIKAREISVTDVETTAWSLALAFKGALMTAVTGQMQDRIPAATDRLVEILWDGLRRREETA